MILKNLISKKSLTILGINSGTSADGVDLALIRFGLRGSNIRVKYIDGHTAPYSVGIRADLDNIIRDDNKDFEKSARFNIAFGHYLGKIASKFIGDRRHSLDLIASHGQTIGHYPNSQKILGYKTAATVQIGDGNAIAQKTGKPVIADFRQADIALGGEGAPLTPFVNQQLFAARKKSRIIVNIGGISNFSYHPAGGSLADIRGGDCGPGNILSDLASRLLLNKKYDRNGAMANQGTINEDVVKLILDAKRQGAVSTGLESYDPLLLARVIHAARKLKGNSADILASLIEATAQSIFNSIRKYLLDKKLEALYLTGGGRHNRFLVKRLSKLCAPCPIRSVDDLGYNGDYLEAISFAVLGGCFLYEIPSTLPHIYGKKDRGDARRVFGIAGKLSLPPGLNRR